MTSQGHPAASESIGEPSLSFEDLQVKIRVLQRKLNNALRELDELYLAQETSQSARNSTVEADLRAQIERHVVAQDESKRENSKLKRNVSELEQKNSQLKLENIRLKGLEDKNSQLNEQMRTESQASREDKLVLSNSLRSLAKQTDDTIELFRSRGYLNDAGVFSNRQTFHENLPGDPRLGDAHSSPLESRNPRSRDEDSLQDPFPRTPPRFHSTSPLFGPIKQRIEPCEGTEAKIQEPPISDKESKPDVDVSDDFNEEDYQPLYPEYDTSQSENRGKGPKRPLSPDEGSVSHVAKRQVLSAFDTPASMPSDIVASGTSAALQLQQTDQQFAGSGDTAGRSDKRTYGDALNPSKPLTSQEKLAQMYARKAKDMATGIVRTSFFGPAIEMAKRREAQEAAAKAESVTATQKTPEPLSWGEEVARMDAMNAELAGQPSIFDRATAIARNRAAREARKAAAKAGNPTVASEEVAFNKSPISAAKTSPPPRDQSEPVTTPSTALR